MSDPYPVSQPPRSSTLARLADDCEAMVKEIKINTTYATERILTLTDMATIFRNAAKRERKLR